MRICLTALLGAALALLPFTRADEPAKADKPAVKPDKPADKEPAKKTTSIAHIKLSGSMDEKAPTSDPLLGTLGETFKTRIDRIKKAGKDGSVAALLLELDGPSLGWGKMNELTRAIASVRAGGKKVYAYVEGGSNADFMIALACDDICVPDASWLMLTGLRLEATFYKGLLEKIGIKADMLQMGDFKGAAEPYTRDTLSEANRKQLTALLDDFFDNELVARIVAGRKKSNLTADKVKKLIDAGPYSAKGALQAGLIDRVAYLDAYELLIKKGIDADSIKVVRDYGKKKQDELDIFSLYRKLIFGPSKPANSKLPKIALIYASGAIMTGKSGASLLGGDTVGSETMVKAIRQAEEDVTVKAIVLRVDSPGGSALASDLIWKELKRCKKPVIASMSDVAASGGYYISMAASKIYAEPGTITGSIGVVGGKMALRGVYDKIGIKTEVISRGTNSGLLSTTDPFTESQRKAFRSLMQDTYDLFVDKALEGRKKAGVKMSRDQLLKLAGGRVYTGRQAKEAGLIDELGTLEDAIAAAAKLARMPATIAPELLILPKLRGLLDSLLGAGLDTSLAATIRKVPGLSEQLRGVDTLLGLRGEPIWAIAPFRIEVK